MLCIDAEPRRTEYITLTSSSSVEPERSASAHTSTPSISEGRLCPYDVLLNICSVVVSIVVRSQRNSLSMRVPVRSVQAT